MKQSRSYFLFLVLILCTCGLNAQKLYTVNNLRQMEIIGTFAGVLEDPEGTLTLEEAKQDSSRFVLSNANVPNLGVSNSVFWIRLEIMNQSPSNEIYLELSNPIVDQITFYNLNKDSSAAIVYSNAKAFDTRPGLTINGTFPLNLASGEKGTYLIRVKSSTQLLLPMFIGDITKITHNNQNRNLIQGLYFGIMIVMFLYNLFIFFTVKDQSYLYYIIYILSVALVQVGLTGVGFKYIWSDFPQFERGSIYLFSAFTAFASLGFIKKFLKTDALIPKTDRISWIFVAVYVFIIVAAMMGNRLLAYNLLNFSGLLLALYMMAEAIIIRVRFKSRPALFFLVAWSMFLSSVILFVVKDSGILPYNNTTASVLQIGSSLEAILLSFALADRINIFKREKEASQAESLRIARENERIIREQNVMLEAKVEERTSELTRSNTDLNNAMEELKQTQSQLVEQEKMASLGQLTAGVAHEINNPINFVLANVNPMKRDVDLLMDMMNQMENIASSDLPQADKVKKVKDLKEEFDYDYLKTEISFLLKGISEGSSRTAEIVKGLRIFSRVDEDDIKVADINEGLDSTIIICNNLLGTKIKVIRDYGKDILAECYPGKLNQVFMNMLSNAIYAIKLRFNEESGGEVTITTKKDDKSIFISFRDNGIGMDEMTLKKLFEPFFTTKPVGEGTGLGLSIAYNTIKKHSGVIEVQSEPGKGTDFTIIIPIKQTNL